VKELGLEKHLRPLRAVESPPKNLQRRPTSGFQKTWTNAAANHFPKVCAQAGCVTFSERSGTTAATGLLRASKGKFSDWWRQTFRECSSSAQVSTFPCTQPSPARSDTRRLAGQGKDVVCRARTPLMGGGGPLGAESSCQRTERIVGNGLVRDFIPQNATRP
jgi:hypothetical protein